jgi:hypothetical protein
MRVSEIIRQILDVIDDPENQTPIESKTEQSIDAYNDEIRRFRQIVDLADQGNSTEYSNTPKEEYAGLDSVTSAAGGGIQIPKDPADIRGEHPSLYPGKVYGVR